MRNIYFILVILFIKNLHSAEINNYYLRTRNFCLRYLISNNIIRNPTSELFKKIKTKCASFIYDISTEYYSLSEEERYLLEALIEFM